MAKIAILTCANATQEANCASTGCLRDLRARVGFFGSYPADEPLELVGIISCAGCPTIVAPDKILRKVASVAEYGIDALHLSFCVIALCPFAEKYRKSIQSRYPALRVVSGTHPAKTEEETRKYRTAVREILAPTVQRPQDMNSLIQRKFRFPEG